MRLLLLLLVPGVALADPPEFKPYRERRIDTTVADAEQGAAKLAAAIRARDARAVQRQLAKTVHFEGAWFAETACRKRFGRREVVKTTASQAALARCLAGVKLQLSTRRSASDDGAVLTIDPGIEVELAFDGTRVRWIGFVGQATEDALVPTLTAQAFEALRTAGSPNLDAVLKTPLDKTVARTDSASAWLRVCLDAKGTITSASVRETSPALDEVRDAFAAAARDWKFKPFSPSGVATPACSLTLLTYPAAKAPDVEVLPIPASPPKVIVHKVGDDELDGLEGGEEGGVVGGTIGGPPPPPPPPPAPRTQNVPPTLLEGLRRAGDRQVLPDAATKRAIAKSGKAKVIGVWKLCLDTRGEVSTITMLKSTGFAGYDKTITSAIRRWKYRPYTANGTAQPVCTAVTFIYPR